MRDIVYYGLLNGTVIASAIFLNHSIRKPLVGSSRRLNVVLPIHSPSAELRPIIAGLRADISSLRDEVMEKLNSIHSEMHEHIAACKHRRLNNSEKPKD